MSDSDQPQFCVRKISKFEWLVMSAFGGLLQWTTFIFDKSLKFSQQCRSFAEFEMVILIKNGHSQDNKSRQCYKAIC